MMTVNSMMVVITILIQALLAAEAVHDSMNFILKPQHRECNLPALISVNFQYSALLKMALAHLQL